jgi:acyl-CoA thioester hydrolase
MNNYSIPVSIRWADIDANRHLRHSAYYDFAAAMRMTILIEHGLSGAKLEELQIGPILFREEAIFKREIVLEDKLTIDIQVVKSAHDFSRLSFRHQLVKADGTLAAIINVDVAWIDLLRRKLTVPPDFVREIFDRFPKTPDFQWVEVPVKKV